MAAEPCRLCLSTADNSVYVLNNFDLLVKIKECVSIQITSTETYSKFVCAECLKKVEKWHEFKMICLNSKIILEERLKENDTKLKNPNCFRNNDNEKRKGWQSLIEMPEVPRIDRQEHNKHEDVMSCDVSNPIDRLNADNNVLNSMLIFGDAGTRTSRKIRKTFSNIEESNGKEIFTCDYCMDVFDYFTDYLDHQNFHNDEAVFYCETCKMTFSNRQDLVWHEKKHKIPCHICGTAVQKQSMKLHLNKHTDRFKCSHCLLTFTCKPLLNEHISARHMKLKQHFCDTCGKNFATRSSLTLHLKIHSNYKQYKCALCDYTGKTSISVKIHMSKHENGTYICEHCSKIFKSVRNLRDHLRRVHKSDKKYSCEFCNMKFALRYLVEQHKRSHTGIHPYKCSKCFKTFARSDGLKEHALTHEKIGVFKCLQCIKIFRTKRGLKRHNCAVKILESRNEISSCK